MQSRLLLLAGAAALGACSTMTPTAPPDVQMGASGMDRHEITVEQASSRLDVPVAAGDLTLSDTAQAQIASFASSYMRIGHGSLILSTPSGGANADSASLIAHQTRLALTNAGVPHAAVAGSTYDASGAETAPLVLVFSRYEARGPECAPLWQQDLAHQSNNQPWDSFGCSAISNLAAMIEDPHDLLRPRDQGARDSGRRGTVMEAYRAGEPTHAERSNDERVAVSAAVNN